MGAYGTGYNFLYSTNQYNTKSACQSLNIPTMI